MLAKWNVKSQAKCHKMTINNTLSLLTSDKLCFINRKKKITQYILLPQQKQCRKQRKTATNLAFDKILVFGLRLKIETMTITKQWK